MWEKSDRHRVSKKILDSQLKIHLARMEQHTKVLPHEKIRAHRAAQTAVTHHHLTVAAVQAAARQINK
jgi:hypothetical protein